MKNSILNLSKIVTAIACFIFIISFKLPVLAAPTAPSYKLYCVGAGNTGSGTGTPYCEWYTSSGQCSTVEGVGCTGPYATAAACIGACPY